jgi:hypothetical protein
MGLKWFLSGILIVSGTTYILAVYIKDILEIFHGLSIGTLKPLRPLFTVIYLAFLRSKKLERGKEWTKKWFREKLAVFISKKDLREDISSV